MIIEILYKRKWLHENNFSNYYSTLRSPKHIYQITTIMKWVNVSSLQDKNKAVI